MITDKEGKEVSEIKVIQAYFGRKPDQSIQGFMDEVKQLSPTAKREVAELAALALGYVITD